MCASDLSGAKLVSAKLAGANLAGSNLTKVSAIQCDFEGADLSQSVLEEASTYPCCIIPTGKRV